MKKMPLKLFSLFALFFISRLVHAEATCGFSNYGQTNISASVNGSPVISVTPDLPNGTRIYTGRIWYTGGSSIIHCSGDASAPFSVSLMASVINGRQLGDNKTFDSGYPGIGVQFWINGGYITADGNKRIIGKSGNGTLEFSGGREITIFLVKTGDVMPGIMELSRVPEVNYQWQADNNAVVETDPLSIFHFTGQITISTPTCTPPGDMTVELGEYTSTEISNNGVSPWKDASIRLTGCPRFTGYGGAQGEWNYSSTGTSDVSFDSGTPPVYGPNRLGLTLNGVQGNQDAANGIVDIDSSTGAASGVALQLARGDTGNNTPVQLGVENIQNIPMDGGSTIDIPLVVRIVKLKNEPAKAGRISAQVTYLINYK